MYSTLLLVGNMWSDFDWSKSRYFCT